jgi:hypothetical protein
MRVRALISYILLSIFLIFIFFPTAHATEYREVKAEEILDKMEKGEDVDYDSCIIVGELNASKLKSETISNPFYDQLRKGIDEDILNNELGISKNYRVVESDIIITNSIFKDNFNFSNVDFNGSVNLYMSNFTGSATFTKTIFEREASFNNVTFNSSANFNFVKFYDVTNFQFAKFNKYANFSNAQFKNYVFFMSTFNNLADFESTFFDRDAFFVLTNFNSQADFKYSSFKSNVDFGLSNFNNTADFSKTNFKNDANFDGPKKFEKIITDETSYGTFIKYYNNLAQYTDADRIYYTYRKNFQGSKSFTELSKWTDILSWITCGFGVKPLNTIMFSIISIFLFSIIYLNPVYLDTINNKKIPLTFSLKNPGIVNNHDHNKKASLLDLIYYSISKFTLTSQENWYPKDNFRKWVALEGIFGYVVLAIFMATLNHVLVRF